MSLLVRFETLWLFVKPFSADDKQSRNLRETFLQPIQMQLSKIWTFFVKLSLHFSNEHKIVKISKKKVSIRA